VRVFTNYRTSIEEFGRNFPRSSLIQPDYEVHLNESGPADMALVLGHARPGMWVKNCHLGIYKLIQDPPQPGIFGRYTRYAPAWADETLTPFPDETCPNRRIALHPAIYNWHLGITFDEVLSLDISDKPLNMSCIASTKRNLPGHFRRFEFVRQIEKSNLEIDIFGTGRTRQLPDGKLHGLLQYRYSIAIENTVHDNYFTEKILDCWLAGAVPIYYGAANLEKYFPSASFIRLNSLDFEEFESRFNTGEFTLANFASRQDAVAEARRIVIETFSMNYLISLVIQRGELNPQAQSRKRVSVVDLDSYSHCFRDLIAFRIKT
jgi:hypothetical protein